jgi:hypothetical protein
MWLGVGKAPAQGQAKALAPEGPPFPKPPSTITSALATVPADFAGVPAQSNFDLYSWLTFVALNWPADTTSCGPDLTKSILSSQGPTVWETYLQDSDVFVAPGDSPSSWCPQSTTRGLTQQLARVPQKVRELSVRTGFKRFLHQDSKASSLLAEKFPGIDQAVGGVLTDQNGRFVRYEIRVNQDEYTYITKNTL